VAPRNYRRQDLVSAAERSLRALKSDRIDLYQLHWPNYKVPLAETMSAMESLVDTGKIRFIGVSNFSRSELVQARRAMQRHPIVSNQVSYSLIDRSIERDLLEYCQEQNITVLAYSPFGNDFARLKAADPEDVLSKVADASGKTRAQVALNWLLVKQGVVAIPKAATVEHVLDDCGASGWQLTQEQSSVLGEKIVYRSRGWLYASLKKSKRYVAQSIGRAI
jgi:diketogulonate reductase-like aldo/keto reductase